MTLATMANNINRFCPGLNPDLIKSNIQDSYKLLMSKEWNKLNQIRSFPTVIPYATGTVSITPQGVVTVVGGTFSAAMVGRQMRVYYDDCFFEIESYSSPTLTLKNWTGEAIPAGTSCTAANATETFTSAAHGLSNGDRVYILASTLPTGLSSAIQYYVISATTNTFQVSLTAGGAAVTFTTDGTAVRWAQTLEAFSIFQTIYSMDPSFGLIYDIIYQIPLIKKSQSFFNKIDPSRTSTSSSPFNWAFAGVITTEIMTLDVAATPSTFRIGATVTGATSLATCVIVGKLSTTSYIVKDRSGTFTLEEILSDGVNSADQGAANPTFASSGTGIIQVEIYPVLSSVVSLRAYGKIKYSTLGDTDSPILPEDLIESHALISCYQQKEVISPKQGWEQKALAAVTIFTDKLMTYEEEDYFLEAHPNKVKDKVGEPPIPIDDNFALDHDVG